MFNLFRQIPPIGQIPIFNWNLSWVEILSYLSLFVTTIYKVWRHRKTIPNAFKLKKHLQWKCIKDTLKVLQNLSNLDIKIAKFFVKNPTKTLLDFAEENGYFLTDFGSVNNFDSVTQQAYEMNTSHIDHFLIPLLTDIDDKKVIDHLSFVGVNTNNFTSFDKKLMITRIKCIENMYNHKYKELQERTKITILGHNAEIQSSLKKMKEYGLLSSPNIPFSTYTADHHSTITDKFKDIFKCE